MVLYPGAARAKKLKSQRRSNYSVLECFVKGLQDSEPATKPVFSERSAFLFISWKTGILTHLCGLSFKLL
jgi:hypothetical protein